MFIEEELSLLDCRQMEIYGGGRKGALVLFRLVVLYCCHFCSFFNHLCWFVCECLA
ncbi:hypothetical protein Hanom_Chr01g00012661 [Helianthus anomalus]